MVDVTWSRDKTGFQTQAVGNYPEASDACSQDISFQSDQGWV